MIPTMPNPRLALEWAIDQQAHGFSRKCVLMYLAHRAQKEPGCLVKLADIHARCEVQGASTALDYLVGLGELGLLHDRRMPVLDEKSNRFHVRCDLRAPTVTDGERYPITLRLPRSTLSPHEVDV